MNIVKAKKDANLLKPFFADGDGSIDSWRRWEVFDRCSYGLPVKKPANLELIRRCTGRDPAKLHAEGYPTTLAIVGRRSGKSKEAAAMAFYEACLSGKEKLLSRGEIGMVPVISPTKLQSQIVKSYIRAIFESTPMLQNEVVEE